MTQVKEFLIWVWSVMDIHSTRLSPNRPTFLVEKWFSPEDWLYDDWLTVGNSIRSSLKESNYVFESK